MLEAKNALEPQGYLIRLLDSSSCSMIEPSGVNKTKLKLGLFQLNEMFPQLISIETN